MPNFTDKVKRLERLRLALRRRYGVPTPAAVTHPLDWALRAILAEEATAAQVDAAMERLRKHFVDLNDLRVSRPKEVRDVLGPNFPRSGHKARVIPRILDQIFKQHNSMVWDFVQGMGKVETRTYFEKLEDVRPFVAAVLARDCAGAHAFPVENDISRVLGRLSIVDPATESESDMQAFLERAVKANRAYEIHWLLKRLAEELCVVETPDCGRCPLNPMCPSAVCPPGGKAPKKKAPAAAAAPAEKPKAAAKAKVAPARPAKAGAARKKAR